MQWNSKYTICGTVNTAASLQTASPRVDTHQDRELQNQSHIEDANGDGNHAKGVSVLVAVAHHRLLASPSKLRILPLIDRRL